MKKILLLTILLVFSSGVYADHSVSHLIGNTGYMIREAMHAGAQKKAKANFEKALKHQKLAKKYLRGKVKGKRSLSQAKSETLKAYEYAKKARDEALQK